MKFKQIIGIILLTIFALINFKCNENNTEGYTNILLHYKKTTLQIKLPLEFDTWQNQKSHFLANAPPKMTFRIQNIRFILIIIL